MNRLAVIAVITVTLLLSLVSPVSAATQRNERAWSVGRCTVEATVQTTDRGVSTAWVSEFPGTRCTISARLYYIRKSDGRRLRTYLYRGDHLTITRRNAVVRYLSICFGDGRVGRCTRLRLH